MMVVRVQDLPKEEQLKFPLDTNPRAQNLNTKVAKRIEEALHQDKDQFYFQNRGLLLSVSRVRFEKQGHGSEGGVCELLFEEPEQHGLVDGGHTYKILLEAGLSNGIAI